MKMDPRGFANERETIRDFCLTEWCHPFITSECFLLFKIFSTGAGGVDFSEDLEAR